MRRGVYPGKFRRGVKCAPGPGKSGPGAARAPAAPDRRPGTTGPAPERCRPAPPPRSAAAVWERRPDQFRPGWTSGPARRKKRPDRPPAPRSAANAGQLQRPQEAHHAQRPRPGQTNSRRRKSSAQAPYILNNSKPPGRTTPKSPDGPTVAACRRSAHRRPVPRRDRHQDRPTAKRTKRLLYICAIFHIEI